MDQQPTEIDKAISALTSSFAEELNALAVGNYLREGVLRQAVKGLIWEIF